MCVLMLSVGLLLTHPCLYPAFSLQLVTCGKNLHGFTSFLVSVKYKNIEETPRKAFNIVVNMLTNPFQPPLRPLAPSIPLLRSPRSFLLNPVL
jgi:hypothetical protein